MIELNYFKEINSLGALGLSSRIILGKLTKEEALNKVSKIYVHPDEILTIKPYEFNPIGKSHIDLDLSNNVFSIVKIRNNDYDFYCTNTPQNILEQKKSNQML